MDFRIGFYENDIPIGIILSFSYVDPLCETFSLTRYHEFRLMK